MIKELKSPVRLYAFDNQKAGWSLSLKIPSVLKFILAITNNLLISLKVCVYFLA